MRPELRRKNSLSKLFSLALFSRSSNVLLAGALLLGLPFFAFAQKPKLPKPRVLGQNVRLQRDSTTGELRVDNGSELSDPGALSGVPPIRAGVGLVEIGCRVIVRPNTQLVGGLTRDDFRLWEDGVPQTISTFDAATQPASIVLVLDASPSIYRELEQMRDAAESLSRWLHPQDEVAVVAFADQAELLLPFSRDRAQLTAALGSPELARVANSSQSYIYQALYISAKELLASRSGRKAIVVVTDGQDSGLGLTWNIASMQPRRDAEDLLSFEDVARELAADGVDLYAISTENRPRAMTDAWLAERRHNVLITPAARDAGIPEYTLYLAEMVRQVGGEFYFLREMGGFATLYRQIALTLGAEYTLGYYPSAGISKPGWRTVNVDLSPEAAASSGLVQVIHRESYYVPALP